MQTALSRVLALPSAQSQELLYLKSKLCIILSRQRQAYACAHLVVNVFRTIIYLFIYLWKYHPIRLLSVAHRYKYIVQYYGFTVYESARLRDCTVVTT